MPPAQLSRIVTSPIEASADIQQILIDIYRRDPKNAELCERLVDLDEGRSGVALPAREDGRADDRRQARNRRLERRPVSSEHRRQANLSRPLGNQRAPLTNPLAAHYSRFRVAERLLLTGHSHQAWPDVAFEAQQRAWLDAAEFVDDKWARAAQAAKVREGFARLLGDSADNIALGQNTHELVTRWLSALPLRQRQRIVTTNGEFHTIRRQLDRLAEEGVEVVRIAAAPAGDLGDRVARAVDDRTLAVMVSSVLFETAEIVSGLDRVAAACEAHGAALLVDAYHHLNVVPFDVARWAWNARSSPAAATSTASLAKATASCACRRAAGCGRS